MPQAAETPLDQALAAALEAHRKGDWELAEATYRRILAEYPNATLAILNLGMLLRQHGQLPTARQLLERAVELAPESAAARFQLGSCLLECGHADAAHDEFQRGLARNPEHAECSYGLSRVAMARREWSDAEARLREAIELDPQRVAWRHDLALVLLEAQRRDAASRELEAAIQIAPEAAPLHVTRANALLRLNRVEEAVASFGLAFTHSASPDIEHSLALAELYAGDFENGLEHFEARLRLPTSQAKAYGFELPFLESQDLDGQRVLVYPEQGLGDAIQFARYVPMLHERCARVFLGCPDPLVALFRNLDGVESLVHGRRVPDCDLQCPMLSLPRYFGTRVESIPARVPYLAAPSERAQTWARHLAAIERDDSASRLPRIGFVWAGNPDHPDDHNRSLDLEQLHGVFRQANPSGTKPRAHLYSLQVGPRARQLEDLPAAWQVHDVGGKLRDFADTAALVAQLDLVVCVDTSVAHLAGALGRPLWLLLPYRTDWRWRPSGNTTPWYPSARLFRQSQPVEGCAQSWQSALATLERALAAWLDQDRAGR